ncbi:hypothetical protein MCETHM1_03425 [Flavobacteriaceae bacterium]
MYISTNERKTKEIVKIINSNESYYGIAANSEIEAIQQFSKHNILMVIFGCNIKRDIEHELSNYFKKINPNIILLDPYGGGVGLLHQEISYAFENQ